MKFRLLARWAMALGCLLVAAGCESSSTPAPVAPGPAPTCHPGPPTCAPDGRAIVACQNGQLVLVQACPGPRGCAPAGNSLTCDPAAAPAAPCIEGSYSCSADRGSMLVCRGGAPVVASTCRGPRGCQNGDAIGCDHTAAVLGDPCDDARSLACSTDRRAVLRCNGRNYAVDQTCPNACLAATGRVLCQ